MDVKTSKMTTFEYSNFPHLTEEEWHALYRLSKVIGESAVTRLLRSGEHAEQQEAARSFMAKENIALTSATPKTNAALLGPWRLLGPSATPNTKTLITKTTCNK